VVRALRADLRWRNVAYVNAIVISLALGYFIAGNPLQVSDNLANLVQVQQASLRDILADQFTGHAFLRPLLWAQLDITFDLARGHYYETYKAIHIAQVLIAGVLVVSLLRVRTPSSACGAALAVAMLFGSRTFAGTVYEGFPINTYLTIVLCCLSAAWLALGNGRWWRDVSAVVLFAFAALTVETGLLVWVVLAAAWLAGARGVSSKALLVTTALLVTYFALRFGPLHVGTPALDERSSGFGFQMIERDQLAVMFADRRYVFYAYNVLSQLAAVLFAEPKSGVWVVTRDAIDGSILPYQVIAVCASTGATILIAWLVASRWREWRAAIQSGHARSLTDTDRLVVIFVAVLGTNALVSYPYTKDVIMSPAGAFHALAAGAALAALLERVCVRSARRLVLSIALCALCATWSIRLVAINYALREHAWIVRNDWTEVFGVNAPIDFTSDSRAVALARTLQHDAIVRRVPASYFAQPYANRVLEIPW
jgi:hypothetical protein